MGKVRTKTEIRISVRSLVEYALRSGDLTLGFASSKRSVEGIRGHQSIQHLRSETYVREVSIQYVIETEEVVLTLTGRIDGVQVDSDGVLIDEIKTTYTDPDRFAKEENPLDWAQVKIYAYIYAMDNHLDSINAQLTYFQLNTSKILEFRRSFGTDELKVFFNRLIDRYLKRAEMASIWRRQRDDSIVHLEFPFRKYRPGQRKMAIHVFQTIKTGNRLFVQAATGIGKTIAALFPAIKAMGEGYGSKIFFLTARTTGRAAAEQALEELRQNGLKLKSITITAKDKICPHPERTCSGEECPYAKGYYDHIDEAVGNIFEKKDTFTRDVIETAAKEAMLCPFEFSLDLSLWADCIICDYNYVFDPRVYLKRFFLEKDTQFTLLIDEAHNLVDRSREMYSAELRKQAFLDVRRPIKEHLLIIYKSIGKVNSWLIKARKKCESNHNFLSQREAPTDLYPHLRRLHKLTEDWLARNIQTSFRDDLMGLYFDVHGFLRISENYNEGHVTRYKKEDKDLFLKLVCIDPSEHLAKILDKCRGIVFFSGTLTPVPYFMRILGCNDKSSWLELPSPFPADNFSLLISNRIPTYYRQRHRTKQAILHSILTVVKEKRGNYLCFFPSYEYLMMVYEPLIKECMDLEIIVQTPEMSENDRDRFLERFSENNAHTLVGFVVMGGIFGEGIDLVGERLSGAVIIGVGLPGISPERDLIKDYFARSTGNGFEYAYQYPGMNRVLQAAGRVIRSETDQGVVLLIDDRFTTNRYRSLFPADWRPITIPNDKSLKEQLKKFWK